MGNSISQTHEQQHQQQQQPQPQQSNNSTQSSTSTNRVRFSASLSSLSQFTSKYLFRTRKSYSLSTIDQSINARPTSHRVSPKKKPNLIVFSTVVCVFFCPEIIKYWHFFFAPHLFRRSFVVVCMCICLFSLDVYMYDCEKERRRKKNNTNTIHRH